MSKEINKNGYRLAHTMIRVRDLEASFNFYCKTLGMKILRKTDYPEGKFTNAFIGYGLETESPCLELTHNWDQKDDYDKGNGWGHVCIETPDVYKACDDLSKLGINITRKPGPMKHGTRVIAFCEDPDGYKVELNEPIKT
jgi:lactoylglutathione lyase